MMRGWLGDRNPDYVDEGVESSNSWYHTDEEEENVRRVKGPSHNNVHLTGLMQNPETGKSAKLKMVVDQGQTVRQGILISEET